MREKVRVNDLMQKDYVYYLTNLMGKNFDLEFKPELTPKQMLKLGVFGGKYMSDCKKEFPKNWFIGVKLCHKKHDSNLNFFKVNASQSLSEWNRKGWIYGEDPRRWFQWYCRYYMGRRCFNDARQIKRWKMMVRHVYQVKRNCVKGDFDCHRKQRQALLYWA